MFRDRLVCGVSDKNIQRRLLLESDLTYETAHDQAIAMESALKDIFDLGTQMQPTQIQHIHKPNHSQNSAATRGPMPPELTTRQPDTPCTKMRVLKCHDVDHRITLQLLVNLKSQFAIHVGRKVISLKYVDHQPKEDNMFPNHNYTVYIAQTQGLQMWKLKPPLYTP